MTMVTDHIFNNTYVLSRMEEYKKNKNLKIIQELQQMSFSSDADFLSLYEKSVSMHQAHKQKNGEFLEKEIIVGVLDKNGISYKSQVTIDKSGIIVGFGEKKKCYHIIDFVIGDHIEVGASITKYKVVSCKTTCRERWTQDSWTEKFIPMLYILVTISNDYPPAERFRECKRRKIITCLPKKNDDRAFKLNFENLIEQLLQ